MPIVSRPRCAAILDFGPWKGQRCTETRNLVKCENAIENGCEKYYCLIFHWHDHWNEHT